MKIFALFFLTLFAVNAFAFPEAPFDALSVKNLKARNLSYMNEYDFEGIVKLSNCSGSLVAFNGQPLTAPAIVMTNGHCIQKPGGYLNHGEVWTNRPLTRLMRVYDRTLGLHKIETTKIIYATMTNTDVAFYELTESYQDIFNRTNVRPFLLDSVRPLKGSSIDIISGYWDSGYSCEIDDFVFKIMEGGWIFTDSIRYTSGCDTIGGTSGSPIILRGERKVIAINNTSNRDGGECSLNNPCEINENDEVTVRKGGRYGQQTYQVYSCLRPDFQVDVNLPGCELPR